MPPRPSLPRTAGALGLALVLGLGAPGLTACGSYSEPAPPTGVDELVVPTPSPDPADFVARVDNPWFVLDETSYAAPDGELLRRAVAPGPRVAGVATTAATLDGTTDLYAQDVDGNVWWFARVGEWEAGQGGALAGLVMPAEPRTGDGFRRAEVPGDDLRAEVVAVDGGAVVLEVVDGEEVTLERYLRGAGLESVQTPTGEVLLRRS